MKTSKKYRKKANKKDRDSGWKIKNQRPEEALISPEFYYSEEEIEKYSKSGGMRRAQEKLAYRVLELLSLQKKSRILDLGCGPGFTAEVYRSEGHKVICLDLMLLMIKKTKEKGFSAFVGDMRNVGEIFKGKIFDAVVSVSALQWVKKEEDITQIAKGIYSLLKKDSPLVIQFYPKSEMEAKDVFNLFIKNGFYGQIITDWPNIPKNRTIYLSLKRK